MQPPTGLTSAEVAERRAKGLVNVVRKETSRTYGGIVVSNLLNVFNVAVFTMAAVLGGLYAYAGARRTLYDAIAISTVALLNTLIGIFQEVRAKIALDRVSAMARSTATVVREGVDREIPVDEIVVDDVIRLSRGDQVPVDGRVLVSYHCEIDESLLTGESVYVDKDAGDPVLSGSFCVAGQGLMVAEKVGEEAYVHRLTREVRSYKRFHTPLQRHIDRLVEILMVAAAVMGFLVVAAAVARAILHPPTGSRVDLVIETARSVASVLTSMVPMGLILLSTVSFALGVYRISRTGALIQKLNAIESFANVDVVCMDKTGTLTRNELKLALLSPLAPGLDESALRALVGAFAHASTEKNATIAALAADCPAAPGAAVLDEIPFNSRDKYSALALRVDGATHRLVLGAFETVGTRCADGGRPARAILDGSPGMRHLVLASLPDGPDDLREGLARGGALTLLGVVSLADEVRPRVDEVLRSFARHGISLKILSGDAPETVRAVARAAGWIEDTSRVVTGAEIDAMGEAALAETARTCSLFARVSPSNKQAIVASLQAQGRYVAMIGDGVNDVLALKKAELGVAMGAGNRMSRDVADIVLLNNDFSILPRVLEEGATIIANVQSAAKLFLTKNMYAIALILFAGFVGLAFPLVPRHVTVIGFFSISVPALLIAFTRRIVDVPRDFLRDVLRFTGISGGCIALAALASYFISIVGLRAPLEQARTVLLTQIVLLSLLNFLVIVGGAHLRENLARNRGMALFAAAFALSYLVLLLLVSRTPALAGIAEFFEIQALTGLELALTLGVSILAGAAIVLLQGWALRRDRTRGATAPESRPGSARAARDA